MSDSPQGQRLRGRRAEREALDGLLEDVQAGQSRVLVLRGAAGIGKSSLLDYLAAGSRRLRVLRAAGVESEMELPFAGLEQLFSPLLGEAQRLPAPQRNALYTAFGLADGNAADPFLVGLAVLSLVSDVSGERPLVCLVDDAQWLDRGSLQALAFIARRLMAESVALVFAVRDEAEEQTLSGFSELRIAGLDHHHARDLFDSVVRGRIDDRVRDRIVGDTHGNPLALIQLSRGSTPAEQAGGFSLPDTGSLAGQIEQSFLRQVNVLPDETRLLLAAAAADPLGDVTLLWRAARRLAIPAEAQEPAEQQGLIQIGARVRFTHPLARSAAYRAASPHDRRTVHDAIAGATDPEVDPDRRAWHRAHAAVAADEDVAAELERSADRAQRRGGVAAAAAFLQSAAELTPDASRRGRRALSAAHAKFATAAHDSAEELLAAAEVCPLDELQLAGLERLRAQIAFARTRGGQAPLMLLKAAERYAPLHPNLARETYLEALGAAIFAGRLAGGTDVREVATAARAAPPAPEPPRKLDLLLDGLATRFTDGSVAAAGPLGRALHAFADTDDVSADDARWLWLACRIAPDVWADEAWHTLSTRQVQLAREAGALAALPLALTYRAGVHVLAGEFVAATALIDEADDITIATGNSPYRYGTLVVDGWRSDDAHALDMTAAGLDQAADRGEGRAVTLAAYATAVLNNALGNHKPALDAALRACEHDDLDLCGWALIEVVEAGARSGHRDVALRGLRRLEERSRASATDWGLGVTARSRAILDDPHAAEQHYREAVSRLTETRIVTELARSRLLYGEWLRREGRRMDAREQLRAAYEMFSTMGAAAFAERARRELLATGETVRKRVDQTRDDLTPQEERIARLAADGQTNPEIAARLFLSPRTVEWHLGKVFVKLDVSSRRDLRRILPSSVRLTDAR
jgi:DNA-binding CsgD family transcriptional regulator